VTDELLKKEVDIQLQLLDVTVQEVSSLRIELTGRDPTIREIAAAGAFLADFYSGIENILKRISYHYGVNLPVGDNWHFDLFARFCAPGFPGLPMLIDDDLREPLAAYRRFRHVVHHGYVLQLQWNRMAEGVQCIDQVYQKFKANLQNILHKS
jgi:hypothetical protein